MQTCTYTNKMTVSDIYYKIGWKLGVCKVVKMGGLWK